MEADALANLDRLLDEKIAKGRHPTAVDPIPGLTHVSSAFRPGVRTVELLPLGMLIEQNRMPHTRQRTKDLHVEFVGPLLNLPEVGIVNLLSRIDVNNLRTVPHVHERRKVRTRAGDLHALLLKVFAGIDIEQQALVCCRQPLGDGKGLQVAGAFFVRRDEHSHEQVQQGCEGQ